MRKFSTIEEYRSEAEATLPEMARSYYMSGARDEITSRKNRSSWQELDLYFKVLVDVSERDCSIDLLGDRLRSPILIAPTAFHGLAHPDAERATARGASEAGAVYVSSTLSNCSIEEIAEASSGHRWFQLYVYRDRGVTLDLIRRAEVSGCRALVITVDAAVIGTRERDRALGFHLPEPLTMGNFRGAERALLNQIDDDSALTRYVQGQLDPSLTWDDLSWLIDQTHLPVFVKGIIRASDARQAFDRGAAGVIISNHGGRQLDTAPPTSRALPPIVDAVGGRGLLLVDGGIRRGSDVLKAIAMGADAVLIGRPILWGLTCAGARGVTDVLEILREELLEAMALCGCPRLSHITRDLLSP